MAKKMNKNKAKVVIYKSSSKKKIDKKLHKYYKKWGKQLVEDVISSFPGKKRDNKKILKR